MNKITHQPEESDVGMDEFCRDVVKAARASDLEINAALNAPFLYPRIRARINAESESRGSVLVETGKQQGRHWGLSNWGWQWRWMGLGAAIVLLALSGWRWLYSSPAAPLIAQEPPAPTVIRTPAPESVPAMETRPLSVAAVKNKVVAKHPLATLTKARRMMRPLTEEDTEIATDYMPLTYVANGEEQSGQVVRVEMPRSAMLALGLPVDDEPTGELVKADVLVGDDGLALAIRFVHTATKRPE